METRRRRSSRKGGPSRQQTSPVIHEPVNDRERFTLDHAYPEEDSWSCFEAKGLDPAQKPKTYIGIDLGTTNSVVAIWHQEKHYAKVIRNNLGSGLPSNTKITPSAWFQTGLGTPNATVFVGQAAIDKAEEANGQPIICSKRILGLQWGDPALEGVLPDLPLEVKEEGGEGGAGARIRVVEGNAERLVDPVEVAARLLAELRAVAEAYLRTHAAAAPRPGAGARSKGAPPREAGAAGEGEGGGGGGGGNGGGKGRGGGGGGGGGGAWAPGEALGAVVGVPAHFTGAQRALTREAARRAGFGHSITLAESTAAAMAYGLFVAGKKTVLVFDMGGGTTDVSLLSIDEGKFQVLAAAGDNHLGGEDMDQRLVDFAHARLPRPLPKRAGAAAARLRRAAQRAKVALSDADRAEIEVADAWDDGGGGGDQETAAAAASASGRRPRKKKPPLRIGVTRREFEEMVAPLVARARGLVEGVLAAGAAAAAGEGSKGGEGGEEGGSDDCGSDGGGGSGGSGSGSGDKQRGWVDEVVLVGGGSRVPAVRAMLREVFPGKELCTAVSADLAVAEGAAIRAAVLSGCDKAYLQGVLMLDVVPLAVGVELADGRFDPVIPKNARLPAVCSREYQLESPEQKGVTLELYEGDGTQERARDNLWVAHFNLPLIRLSPRQLAQYGPGRPRRVVVVLALGEDGALRARVDEADEDEGGSPWATMLLGLWVVLMAVLYVWCRVYFEPTLAEISGRGAHHLPATPAGGSDGSPSPPTSAFPNNIINEEEEEEDAWF